MTAANELTRAELMQATYVGRHGERNFTSFVIDAAQVSGWMVMHISDSRKRAKVAGEERWVGDALCRGWPDLVLVKGERVLFRELKVENGRLSPDQKLWLAVLAAAGCDVGVWWPRDWDEIRDVLEGRA